MFEIIRVYLDLKIIFKSARLAENQLLRQQIYINSIL
jgi:hypothetical protein